MRCEDVRRALPLQGEAPDEEAIVREHIVECADCESLHEAYQADARALEAVRADREVHQVMEGFADSLMLEIAREPAADARVLQPEFGRPASSLPILLAAAAVLLVSLGLGFALVDRDAELEPAVAESPAASEDPALSEGPALTESPSSTRDATQPLAAPRRVEKRAPTPRLRRRRRSRRGGIVPVDGSRRSAPPLLDMLRDLQRVFPNWSPNGLDRRVPPLREGEREVRF